MKIPLLIVATLSAAGLTFAEDAASTLHFNAVLTAGKEKHFGLSAPLTGAKSSWLSVGESFEGYTLKSFDETTQKLTVEKNGKTETIGMDAGSIKKDDTKATIADAQAVIDKMHFDQTLSRMLEQQKKMVAQMTARMANGPGAKERTPEQQAEFSQFQQKMMDTFWAEMKPDEMKKDLASAYSEIFTKDELQGLSDFYDTSTGKALLEKQPAVQQKLSESMMPRMMAVMPKIQQMAQEFAAAHKNPPAAPAAPAAAAPEPAK